MKLKTQLRGWRTLSSEFVIHGKLPTLNDMISANRTHWAVGAKLKKDATGKVAHCALQIKNCIDKPFRITCFWSVSTNHDFDNIASGIKFILDGLQKAGKIKNDNLCKEIHHYFERGDDFVRVVMEIL